MKLIPNFFVVGTPKSGTTSLYNYLEEHPEIFLPKLKEPHFFSYPEVEDTYYKTNIIKTEKKYLELFFSSQNFKARGDLSSSYLFNKNTAERIYQFNPSAKIIIVLRNPTHRAISHYLMDLNLGYINVSLAEVISNKKKYRQHYKEYVELGFYHSQIQAYKTVFPESQIKIVLSDSLFDNTSETLARIYNFLEVSILKLGSEKKVHNQYNQPKFKILKFAARLNFLQNLIPPKFKSKLKLLLFKKNPQKPKLEDEKAKLNSLYKDSINETEAIINMDLSSWK